MFKKIFNSTLDVIKVILISLAIIIPIRYFLIQPFYVKGASMEPSFNDREYLIIDEITYRFKEPIRGEIIVFRYPRDQKEHFIKRIIGLPGEKVQIKDEQVIIYNDENPEGVVIEEPYLAGNVITFGLTEKIISLESGEYYVLGDNRNFSKDSRSFGPIKESVITGRVLFRGWPLDKISLIEAPEYNL